MNVSCSRVTSHHEATSTAACNPRRHGLQPITLKTQLPNREQHMRRRISAASTERDLDWEPSDIKTLYAPSSGGGGGSGIPPPPPPPLLKKRVPWFQWPLVSRRNLSITILGGGVGFWLLKQNFAPIKLMDKPDIDFKILGYTDLTADDFVYFKTAGGHWVAAAEDQQRRLFMVDEIGDLYYDSGDKDIGLYAMDTQGNLFNFYTDMDGERKITPVGNVSELQEFKVSEVAGVKLNNDVSVVAFKDGRQIPLPPGSELVNASGKVTGPGELIEGYTRRLDEDGESPLSRMLGNPRNAAFSPPYRLELDLEDPKSFKRQIRDQVLLDDPDIPGFQPALPRGFSLEKLVKEVEEEGDR